LISPVGFEARRLTSTFPTGAELFAWWPRTGTGASTNRSKKTPGD